MSQWQIPSLSANGSHWLTKQQHQLLSTKTILSLDALT